MMYSGVAYEMVAYILRRKSCSYEKCSRCVCVEGRGEGYERQTDAYSHSVFYIYICQMGVCE